MIPEGNHRGAPYTTRLAPANVGGGDIPFLAFAFAVLLGALPISASAHREATGRQAPANSISIPSLSHGQMAVIANNRAAILDLAARQIPTDPTMRRLEGFINLQFFECLWGMIPGSVEDESSPFNECSHAYLAATRALLLHLQTMPGDRAPVKALIAKIERENSGGCSSNPKFGLAIAACDRSEH